MAEQFILLGATTKLVKNFVSAVKCTITDLQHANIGWTPASRIEYDKMMGLNGAQAIVNRAGLPPHFYIEIPVNTDVASTPIPILCGACHAARKARETPTAGPKRCLRRWTRRAETIGGRATLG